MTPLEKAARALKGTADAWAAGEGCDKLLDWDAEYCNALARAVIEAALSDPDEAVVREMVTVFFGLGEPQQMPHAAAGMRRAIRILRDAILNQGRKG